MLALTIIWDANPYQTRLLLLLVFTELPLFSHCVFPACEVLLKSRLHNDFLKVYQHFVMFNIILLLQIKGTVDFDPLNDYDVTPYMLEMQIACLQETV